MFMSLSINGYSQSDIVQASSYIGKLNWVKCADACKTLKENGHNDWRMPTLEEAFTYRSSASVEVMDPWKTWVWTKTPVDRNFHPTGMPSNFVTFDESLAKWVYSDYGAGRGCRCVR